MAKKNQRAADDQGDGEATEATEAAPTEATEAAPTEATEAVPTEATEAAPTEATEAAPTEATEAAPTEATEAAPVSREPARYEVTLPDSKSPHKVSLQLSLDERVYTFRRGAPIFDSPLTRAAWEEQAKNRPAVEPRLSNTIRMTPAQAAQLARSGWGVAAAQ